ncbi:hypothetical protein OE88DRAFT_263536 [Heliocybe sulcata]|uniref:Uncharacterized protein n=1 Tax=Heliocybe sulcata TaxID=5364 RepID=A0A5C3N0F0_9AGAM|nr:hypothetical protein OE88DRAFT_263536 [Heliocybe sulcata]
MAVSISLVSSAGERSREDVRHFFHRGILPKYSRFWLFSQAMCWNNLDLVFKDGIGMMCIQRAVGSDQGSSPIIPRLALNPFTSATGSTGNDPTCLRGGFAYNVRNFWSIGLNHEKENEQLDIAPIHLDMNHSKCLLVLTIQPSTWQMVSYFMLAL